MRTSTARRCCRRLVPLILAPALLAGCSWQSLGMSNTSGPSAPRKATTSNHSSAKPSSAKQAGSTPAGSSAAARKTATGHVVGGGLANGSATHRLPMGARSMVITYWTTRNVATWTSADAVPVQISASVDGSTREHVYVTSFGATFAPAGAGAATTLRSDSGRFAISSTYPYGTAVVVPAVSAQTRSAQLQVQLELLVETTPGSGDYFRQTVLDTVPFTYAADSTDSTGEKS
jgi:hypothetical protein